MNCTKIAPEFEFGDQMSKVKVTKDKKTKKCGIFFGGAPRSASCVVRQFCAGGKISACCLVSIRDRHILQQSRVFTEMLLAILYIYNIFVLQVGFYTRCRCVDHNF